MMAVRAKQPVLRSCAACGQKLEKRKLIRIVRSLEGRVEVDSTGRKAGRGTYLCPREECWKKGLAKNRLDHVLRSPLPAQDREALYAYYRDQLKPAAIGESP